MCRLWYRVSSVGRYPSSLKKTKTKKNNPLWMTCEYTVRVFICFNNKYFPETTFLLSILSFQGHSMVKILDSLLRTIYSSWDNYVIANVDTPIRGFAFPPHTSVLLYASEISHARMTFSGYRQSAFCWASAIPRCKCLKSSEVNMVISSSKMSPVTTFVL